MKARVKSRDKRSASKFWQRYNKWRSPTRVCKTTRLWRVIRGGHLNPKRLRKVQVEERSCGSFIILNRKQPAWSWILFGLPQREARSRFWRNSFFIEWQNGLTQACENHNDTEECVTMSLCEMHESTSKHSFKALAYKHTFSFEHTPTNWEWLLRRARTGVRVQDAVCAASVAIPVNRSSVSS